MQTLEIILSVVLLIIEFILIGVVLAQKSKTESLTSIMGGNSTESYFSKNRNTSREAKLGLATKISMVVIVILALVLMVLFAIAAVPAATS